MRAFFIRSGSWLLRKLAFCALIVAFGLGVTAAWIWAHEPADAQTHRLARIIQVADLRDHFQWERDTYARQLADFKSEFTLQEARVEQADKIIATLRGLESIWDRWIGNPAQQKANAEQIVRLEELKRGASRRLVELRDLVTATAGALEAAEANLRRTRAELAEVEQVRSPVMLYLTESWRRGGSVLLLVLGVLVAASILEKLFLYHGLAPVIVRGRPVRLAKHQDLVAEASVIEGAEVALWPGERLLIKRRFFKTPSADCGLARGVRLLLSWKIPFTCLICGLGGMIKLHNRSAGGGRQVALGQPDGAETNFTLIDVPEDASMILRPGFLAGVITPANKSLAVRYHWPLFRWQTWVTREFRFLEFAGPCRLIVAGNIRPERLRAPLDQAAPALRIDQEVLVGFTPSLDYQPVRAAGFWRYYCDKTPLFARLLSGTGLCLLQEKTGPFASGTSRLSALASKS
ncbi:MAG: hypothetical protein JF599_10815 [Verrucomicrobia bacterium]|nr:hypothetical protein [Verrucomicrobiota bacterium]